MSMRDYEIARAKLREGGRLLTSGVLVLVGEPSVDAEVYLIGDDRYYLLRSGEQWELLASLDTLRKADGGDDDGK